MTLSNKAPNHVSGGLQIKALSDDGSFEGYGSIFGNQDSYDDIVASGAFKSSLAEHKSKGTMPAMLWQHDPYSPIGKWTEMREDARGLYVKGDLALSTDKGAEAYELLKMGAISGLSIGFRTLKFQYDEQSDIRTLTELDLWEVSLVTFPANGEARVSGVKAEDIQSLKDAEKALREAGLSRSQAVAVIAATKRCAHQREAGEKALSELSESLRRLSDTIRT